MAAVSDRIVAVVGEVDLPHAQALVERQHVGLLQQWQRAFKIEADGEHAFCGCLFDVGHAGREHETIRVGGNFGAEAGKNRHHLRQRIHVHADIDRDIVDARFAQPV